jgi:Ca-activated chloride channel homolog
LAALWWRFRPQGRPAAVFSSVTDLKGLPVTLAQRLRRSLPYLYGLGLCLLITGLARPQAGKAESRISGQGIAIEMVLDVSGSMEAIDFQLGGRDVSRLEAVKHVIQDFVLGSRASGLSGRSDDLVGLVAFGGFADSKCPLTLDHGALVDIVQGLEVPKPIRDSQGRVVNAEALQEELATAIGDGVAAAVDRLRGAKAKSKVLILLTDGDSNAGVVDPREAARIAAE